MNKQDTYWKARIYHDKAATAQIEEDLQVMVHAIIGEKQLEIESGSFDQYPSCQHMEKGYCHCKTASLRGYIRPGGYVFLGNSKIEIYCKIISAIAGNKLYFPYSILPMGDIVEQEGGEFNA